MFAARARRTMDGPGARVTPSGVLRVPQRLEAVGEALASGSGSVAACTVAGGDLAREGVPLEEALDALRTTYHLVRGRDPGYDEVRAVSVGWSDAMLGYLLQVSCEDPLTGLASVPHVRSRIAELYRGQLRDGVDTRDSHALVVVELGRETGPDVWGAALRVTRAAESVRAVFSGEETVARLRAGRIAVLARREDLARRVALLRRLLVAPGDERGTPRVRVEGLPGSFGGAAALLDELVTN
jgi:hypothetical protein